MKIEITKQQKIQLLKGIKEGIFNTDTIPELHDSKLNKPLSPAEAKEYLSKIENEC